MADVDLRARGGSIKLVVMGSEKGEGAAGGNNIGIIHCGTDLIHAVAPDVAARAERGSARRVGAVCPLVTGRRADIGEGGAVRCNVAVEAPLAAHKRLQQVVVRAARRAVDGRVSATMGAGWGWGGGLGVLAHRRNYHHTTWSGHAHACMQITSPGGTSAPQLSPHAPRTST